jgi:O-glycosyl hydrolase
MNELNRRAFLAAAAATVGSIVSSNAFSQATSPATVPATLPTIDREDVFAFNEVHQTIENFSASDAWSCEIAGKWQDEAARNQIADLLFSREKGVGFTAWRINLGAGHEPTIRRPERSVDCFETAPGRYDFSKCPGQRWFAQAAKERGVNEFIAFVNSPPIRMTQSGRSYGNKNSETTNLKQGMENEFARYMLDVVEHFQNAPEPERIPFTHLSPINEPDVAWDGPGQEGCRYGIDDIRRTLKALGEAVAQRKTSIQIVAPETNQAHHLVEGRNYLKALIEHPDTSEILNHRVCYHGYDVVKFKPEAIERRRRVGEAMMLYPGWSLWMSEYCVLEWVRDLTMDTAIRLARLMHFDLTLCNVTAWQWWLALSFGDYKDGIIYADEKTGKVMPAKMLWVMGNYSRFVRPGAKRIGSNVPGDFETQTLASAYRHDTDKQLTIVYVNLDGPPATVKPHVKGVGNSSAWQIYRTSDAAGEDLKPVGESRQGETLTLPPKSVTTLVCKWE